MKVLIAIACLVLAYGIPSCERDTFTEEQVTGFLKEDGEKIQNLESRMGDVEKRLEDLERQMGRR